MPTSANRLPLQHMLNQVDYKTQQKEKSKNDVLLLELEVCVEPPEQLRRAAASAWIASWLALRVAIPEPVS